MTKNVGSTDRIIRFAIAAVVVILLATKTVAIGSTLGIFLAVFGGRQKLGSIDHKINIRLSF